MALRQVAWCLLPAGPPPATRARVRRVAPDLGRGERLVLLAAASVELAHLGRPGAGGLRLRGEGSALHHPHEEARRRRGAARDLPRDRRALARREARPAALAAATPPRFPPRPARLVLRPAPP